MLTGDLTPLQRFWRLLKPDGPEIRNIYAYAVFSGLVTLSLPLGIQAIINLIQGGRVNSSWVVLVILVVLGVGVTGILQIFQLRITENLQQKIFTRAAFEYAYRIPRIKMEALYKYYAPELMNRFFDIVSVQKGLSKILIDFSAAGLQVIFGLILLSLYHPFFILFSLLLVVLIYAIFRFTARKGLDTSLEESEYKYEVAHWLEELARTSTTFKLAGNPELPLQKADTQLQGYLSARNNHFKVLIQQFSLMVAFKVFVALGLLAIGGILVMEQMMNIGQFIAAEIIILLVMASVEKLILSLETGYDVLTALAKIGQVTDLELENDKGMNLKDHCGDEGICVELKNVSFSYPGQTRNVLHNTSITIESGDRVVVTGKNGSGKSTLLQVLAGLYDTKEGTIIYNDLPKGSLNLDSLREVIGDVLSQEQLFEGTIMENISMGRKAATFKNVEWAVKKMGLLDFIKSLPNGYDTVLDPQGKKLPRSISQKLILARSIADRPKLLLLEDILEHIEDFEKKSIIDFLMEKDNPWTMISVSSDPYFVSAAERVLTISDGVIQEVRKNDYAWYLTLIGFA